MALLPSLLLIANRIVVGGQSCKNKERCLPNYMHNRMNVSKPIIQRIYWMTSTSAQLSRCPDKWHRLLFSRCALKSTRSCKRGSWRKPNNLDEPNEWRMSLSLWHRASVTHRKVRRGERKQTALFSYSSPSLFPFPFLLSSSSCYSLIQ